MPRLRSATRILVPAVAAAMLLAAPAASAGTVGHAGPAKAQVAKTKKKKHHKKRRPAAAPQGGGTVAPIQPSDPPTDPDVGWCAGEDAFEPDDDSAHAFTLPYPGSSYTVNERFRCPGDDDYFMVIVPPGGFFAVDADPADDFDLVLHTYGGTSTSSDDGGAGVLEDLNIRNSGTAPIVVSIWVTGASEAATGAYSLRGFET